MEPVKKPNNVLAGFAAVGVLAATAFAVFASTFNPPPQTVPADVTNTPVDASTPTPTPVTTIVTPPQTTPAFGSVFPAPAATTPSTPITTQASTKTTTAVVTKTTPPPAPVVTASTYKDGTYSATGSYNSPGGEDQVAVTLTLSNDIVTAVSVTPETQDRTSARYQAMFMSGYKSYVVGKDISSVHLSKVSGSSLTSIGFNAAISRIESEARMV